MTANQKRAASLLELARKAERLGILLQHADGIVLQPGKLKEAQKAFEKADRAWHDLIVDEVVANWKAGKEARR